MLTTQMTFHKHNQKLFGPNLTGPDALLIDDCKGTVQVGDTNLLTHPDEAGNATVSISGRSYRATKYGMHGLATVKKILQAGEGRALARFKDGSIAAAQIVQKSDEGVALSSWCSCNEETCAHQIAMLYVAAGDFEWPDKPKDQAEIGVGLALPINEYLQRIRSVSKAVRAAHWGSQWLSVVCEHWIQQDLDLAYQLSDDEKWGVLVREHLPEVRAQKRRISRQNPLAQQRGRVAL